MTSPDTKQLIERLRAAEIRDEMIQVARNRADRSWGATQSEMREAQIDYLAATLSALQQPDEPLVGDDGKLTRLPEELAEPYAPDPEAIAKAVQDLKNAMKPDERDEEIARLRSAFGPLVSEDAIYLTGAEKDDEEAAIFVTVGEVRRARTALGLGDG